MKTYRGKIRGLSPNQIFVFGSNTQGRHGAGAALFAVKSCGAIYGVSHGIQGQAYGICTKDLTKEEHPSVDREEIIDQIWDLYAYANENPELEFLVAYSGTGINLNYYTPDEMAEMFGNHGDIPENIVFEEEFRKLVDKYQERYYSGH